MNCDSHFFELQIFRFTNTYIILYHQLEFMSAFMLRKFPLIYCVSLDAVAPVQITGQ